MKIPVGQNKSLPALLFIAVFGILGSFLILFSHAAPNCTPNAQLVNPCRSLIGAAARGNNGIPGQTAPAKDLVSQFNYFGQLIQQPLDIFRDYHTFLGQPKNVDSTLPLDQSTAAGQAETQEANSGMTLDINWNPSQTWKQAMPVSLGGDATINSEIDQAAANIKKIPHKIFFSPWHEGNLHVSAVDNSSEACSGTDTSGFGTPSQFIAAWQNIYNRFKNDGVTNVVWVLNFGTYGPKQCWVPYMWPGSNEVDWVIYDTYSGFKHSNWDQSSGEFYNYMGNLSKSSSTTVANAGQQINAKPWGIGEFGDCNAPTQQQGLDYFNSVTAAVKANTYPKLKMYLMYADTGNSAGPGCLSDFDPNGTYDAQKEQAVNSLYAALMTGGNPVGQPTPIVSIDAPTPNATVSGSNVIVSATASVSQGSINKVVLKVSGTTIKSCKSGSCSTLWDTTHVSNGTYTIEADTAASDGKNSSSSETVTVTNLQARNCIPNAQYINPCRPWFGGTAHDNRGTPAEIASGTAPKADDTSQYNYLESLVGSNVQFDVYRDYSRCTASMGSNNTPTFKCKFGTPMDPTGTGYYLAMTANKAIDINWKPADNWLDAGGGGSTPTPTQQAVNAEILQVARNIKAVAPHKVFLTVWHEPQNDVSAWDPNTNEAQQCAGSTYHFSKKATAGTPDQYVAMWQNVENIFNQQGVTNVEWTADYLSEPPTTFDCIVPMLWPGNSQTDWVLYDTYGTNSHPTWTSSVGSLYNDLETIATNTQGKVDTTSKPWGVGEFGTCGNTNTQSAQDYFTGAKSDYDTNNYPNLKLYLVWADNIGGNGGPGCLTDYDPATSSSPKGVYDLIKQQNFNSFAKDVLNTHTQPETVQFTSPQQNATVSGIVPVNITTSGPSQVTKVGLYINNSLVETMNSSPFVYSWDTTLVSKGSYTLSATAYGNNGFEVSSNPISVTVIAGKPQPPTNLSSPSKSASMVSLAWQDTANPTGTVSHYLVYRNNEVVSMPTTLSYNDSGLAPQTTYTYSVAAVGLDGSVSDMSNMISVTTDKVPDTQPPTVPQNVTATAVSAHQINLTWSASTDNVAVAGYYIIRGGKNIASIDKTNFGDGTVAPNSKHTYQIEAYDAAGNISKPSTKMNVTTPPTKNPNPIHGATLAYWPNPNFGGPSYLTIVPNVNANLGARPVANAPLPIHNKGYGIHWRGRIIIPRDGPYTFYIKSGPAIIGFEFNNKMIIKNTGTQGGEISTTLQLTAGQYNFRVIYTNPGSSIANVSLFWSGPGINKELVPTEDLYPNRFGLTAKYYNNTGLTGNPVLIMLDPNVDFNWGTSKPGVNVSATKFSADWSGYIFVPKTDTYTFDTDTEDGARLWINGHEIINDWNNNTLKDTSGKITLSGPSVYSIDMQYNHRNGPSIAYLFWGSSSFSKQIIPETNLYENLPNHTTILPSGGN